MSVDLKIPDLDSLQRALNRFSTKEFVRIVKPAVNKASTPIIRAMKKHIPVQSGALKKSIGKKIKGYPRNGSVAGMVGPRRNFTKDENGGDPARSAHLVNNGTAPHIILNAYGKAQVHHPGTTGAHFIEKAYSESEAQSARIMRETIARNIEKATERELKRNGFKGRT